jgi:hypothetical protein
VTEATLWRVRLGGRDRPPLPADCRLIAIDQSGPAQILLVEQTGGVSPRIADAEVTPAADEIYVDSATRTTWLVAGNGTSATLLGYLPP